MIPESFQIPALAAVVIALASFIIIPAIAMNDRADVEKPSTAARGGEDGTACALPPALDMDSSSAALPEDPPVIDDNTIRTLKTATFALG